MDTQTRRTGIIVAASIFSIGGILLVIVIAAQSGRTEPQRVGGMQAVGGDRVEEGFLGFKPKPSSPTEAIIDVLTSNASCIVFFNAKGETAVIPYNFDPSHQPNIRLLHVGSRSHASVRALGDNVKLVILRIAPGKRLSREEAKTMLEDYSRFPSWADYDQLHKKELDAIGKIRTPGQD